MREEIALHLGVHLKFFRRNRLLIAIAAVFLAITGVSMLGALVFSSRTSHFETIRAVAEALNGFLRIIVPALGLFLVSCHLRSRSLKMVFTKPATPEVWLLSGLLAALLVAFGLHLLVWLLTAVLSLVWHVPLQTGFAFTALDSFLRSGILLGYLTFLTVVLHPVVAVLVVLVFNENTFYGLMFMMEAASRGLGKNPLLPALREAFRFVYTLLPVTDPLAERSQEVVSSLRTGAGDWNTLAMRAGYTLVVLVFFYLLSTLGLRRRNLS